MQYFFDFKGGMGKWIHFRERESFIRSPRKIVNRIYEIVFLFILVEQAEEWYTNPVIVLYPASWE